MENNEEIDENTFCLAFEKGITDFLSLYASDSEYTIRTIWALQKRNKDYAMQNNQNILAHLNIIDDKNYVYTENYSRTVIKNMSKNEEKIGKEAYEDLMYKNAMRIFKIKMNG